MTLLLGDRGFAGNDVFDPQWPAPEDTSLSYLILSLTWRLPARYLHGSLPAAGTLYTIIKQYDPPIYGQPSEKMVEICCWEI